MIKVLPILVNVLVFVALFTGLQGGRYYLGNALQELGILCSVALYVLGAYYSLFHINKSEWRTCVYGPVLFLAFIMCLWGVVFSVRFGGNPLFNIMASREFMFIFFAPGLYLTLRSGYSLKSLTVTIWICLVMLMMNYLYNAATMDLKDAFFSPDGRISGLVTYDEWRGFRLKPTLFAVMLAMLAGLLGLFQKKGFLRWVFCACVVGLGCYIWVVVQARSTLATMLLAVCCYPLFLSRPNRIHLLIVSIPASVLLLPTLLQQVFEIIGHANGANVRMESYILAIQEIPHRLFLGTGEDSAKGLSYQDLFGPKFFPSDLGLVGIAFKYGLVGLTIYLVTHFLILRRLWAANWIWRNESGTHHPFLWAMLIFMTAQTFNLLLNPGLAFAQGITVACLAFALSGFVLKVEGSIKLDSRSYLYGKNTKT